MRKSFTDSLNPSDCRLLLHFFKLLDFNLVEHIQKKKLEQLFSILIYELVCKVLQSPCKYDSYLREKYEKMEKNLDTHEVWIIPLGLSRIINQSFFFKDLILNEFTCEMLTNGMFIHFIGSKYTIETHQNLNKIFCYFKHENINIFEKIRSSKIVFKDKISLELKLIALMSVSDFDNSKSSISQNWEKVVKSSSLNNIESTIDLLINNFSQISKDGPFKNSIKLGSLNKILGDDDEQVQEFFERIVSNKGLFSKNFTVKNFSARFLAFLALNDSNYVINRLNWLINVKNLSKLTRMNKIIKYIEMDDLELDTNQMNEPEWFSEHICFLFSSLESSSKFTDYLQDFGYKEAINVSANLKNLEFPVDLQISEERTGIFELCSDLQAIEDNELELNSKKDQILDTFCFYVNTISSVLFEILSMCENIQPKEEKEISKNCIVLLKSVQLNIDENTSYMKSKMMSLFLNVYLLSSRKNKVSDYIEFYYHIKTGKEDSSFIRELEKKCELLEDKPEYYSEHLFEMFFSILNFLVEQKLSAKAKKNVLTIVIGYLDKFSSFENKIFEFLVNTINNFYFDFAFEKVNEILKPALKKNGKSQI